MSKKLSRKNTYGWARAEVLGALVNSVFLVALCFTIFVEAIQRLTHSHVIERVDSMIYVGVAGLVVNIIGLILFYSYGRNVEDPKQELKDISITHIVHQVIASRRCDRQTVTAFCSSVGLVKASPSLSRGDNMTKSVVFLFFVRSNLYSYALTLFSVLAPSVQLHQRFRIPFLTLSVHPIHLTLSGAT